MCVWCIIFCFNMYDVYVFPPPELGSTSVPWLRKWFFSWIFEKNGGTRQFSYRIYNDSVRPCTYLFIYSLKYLNKPNWCVNYYYFYRYDYVNSLCPRTCKGSSKRCDNFHITGFFIFIFFIYIWKILICQCPFSEPPF